jgi:hypothetical protein
VDFAEVAAAAAADLAGAPLLVRGFAPAAGLLDGFDARFFATGYLHASSRRKGLAAESQCKRHAARYTSCIVALFERINTAGEGNAGC